MVLHHVSLMPSHYRLHAPIPAVRGRPNVNLDARTTSVSFHLDPGNHVELSSHRDAACYPRCA